MADAATVSDVLREHYADLHRTLMSAEVSRRSITSQLFTNKIISQYEQDRINENERLHGADRATDEILQRIRTYLSVYPKAIGVVLTILGAEQVLKPTVAEMRRKLKITAPTPSGSTSHSPAQHEGSTINIINQGCIITSQDVHTQHQVLHQHQVNSPINTPPIYTPPTNAPPNNTPPTNAPPTTNPISPPTTTGASPQQRPQERPSFDAERLAQVLAGQLQKYCSKLNKFLRNKTLEDFANRVYEAGLISSELFNSPVYNDIALQFTALLECLRRREEFEDKCKKFLAALRGLGPPLVIVAKSLEDDWIESARDELDINLNF